MIPAGTTLFFFFEEIKNLEIVLSSNVYRNYILLTLVQVNQLELERQVEDIYKPAEQMIF